MERLWAVFMINTASVPFVGRSTVSVTPNWDRSALFPPSATGSNTATLWTKARNPM